MPRDDMTREAAEEILELPRRYTKEDLRKAYTDMARRYHPDAAAQHRFDPEAAQARMVEANKAYELLKRQFSGMSNRVIERGYGGIAQGFAGVDWTAGVYDANPDADPWEFAEDWVSEPAPQKPPLSLRTVLLGPVVPRIVFIGLFAWLWWCTFPFLPQNAGRFFPSGEWTLMDAARLVAASVYPSYLLLYETISGYVSGFVREVANGLLSYVIGRYVDLRPRSSSYGCMLYKLLREQMYGLLIAPAALYLAALCVSQEQVALKVVCGVLALLLAVDALAAVTHGGFVNVWTSALAERVEARYLLIRARILKRCGQWDGR